MNVYVCFYAEKRIEVYAETLFKARVEAVRQFKPPKSKEHLVTVILAERADGSEVIHTPID